MDQHRLTETRDAESRRVAEGRATRMHSPFTTSVVGVTFVAGYPANLHVLEQLGAEAELAGERLAVVLRRNPDNEYDANAIEVHVPALGSNGMVGHLTRPIAARLAPALDAGEAWQAEVVGTKINWDHPNRPGLEIRCVRI